MKYYKALRNGTDILTRKGYVVNQLFTESEFNKLFRYAVTVFDFEVVEISSKNTWKDTLNNRFRIGEHYNFDDNGYFNMTFNGKRTYYNL